jgi:DNA-directed RNA polymerase specialized sigma24 family protein
MQELTNPHSLLPVAFHAAATVLKNPMLAEEASERALHLLTLAILQGEAPRHPRAWLRMVARRSACALLRSDWGKTRTRRPEDLAAVQAPYRRSAKVGLDFVRERLRDELSPRQHEALTAAMSCNGTRAAARVCGMAPRDFRRQLGAISRKARQLFATGPLTSPFGESGPFDD